MPERAGNQPGEDEGPGERIDAPLILIARGYADELYEAALDTGDVRSFEEDEDAPAYAICFVENAKGEKGWAVVVARGHSWEGLRIGAAEVFGTPAAARRYVDKRLAEDEADYRERIGERDEEDDEDGDRERDE